jgi:hypothetical protein
MPDSTYNDCELILTETFLMFVGDTITFWPNFSDLNFPIIFKLITEKNGAILWIKPAEQHGGVVIEINTTSIKSVPTKGHEPAIALEPRGNDLIEIRIMHSLSALNEIEGFEAFTQYQLHVQLLRKVIPNGMELSNKSS